MSRNYYDRDRTVPVDEILRREIAPRTPKQRLMQEFDGHQREAREREGIVIRSHVIKRKVKRPD